MFKSLEVLLHFRRHLHLPKKLSVFFILGDKDKSFVICNFLSFIEFLKVNLINLTVLLMMQAKLTTPDLLNTITFRERGYEDTTSIHNIPSKIFPCNSNCILYEKRLVI